MPPAPAPAPLVQLAWPDWLIIGIYFVITFAIAFWAARRIKDCGGYLVGSRKLGKWMLVAASFAGGTNANHPMAVAAAAFQRGLSGIWISLTWMLITPFFWLYPPVVRRLRIVTLADIVRLRFGAPLDWTLKLLLLFKFPVAMGLGIKSAAIVIQVMTGGHISGPVAEALVVFPTLAYTLIGGIVAAYATDIYQGLLIVVLSFLLIPFAISSAGGVAALDAQIADEFTSLLSGAPGDFGFWWIFWFAIGITFAAVLASVGGAATARDENAARASAYGLVLKRFCTVGWGFVGVLAIALFAGHPLLTPGSGTPGASPDNVFPLASGQLLPVGLRGLMVASMLAAVMSSLNSGIIGFGGMMVNNIYQAHLVRSASPAHYLFVARVFSVVGVLGGWWVASTITDIVEFSTVVEPLGGLMGIAILAAIVWRRVTAAGALASFLVAAPLFLAVNFPAWPARLPLFELLHLRPLVDTLAGLYGLDLLDPAQGYLNAAGELARLPVQIKYPLYLVPSIVALVGVSLLTRQHRPRDVEAFYCRLDTPVGQEHRIREAGFQADQIENLDGDSGSTRTDSAPGAAAGPPDRLLLPDLFRLPGLLRRGEVRLADYRRDLLGTAGSIAFVILFLLGVEFLGRALF
jgi:Na+/proline symporter